MWLLGLNLVGKEDIEGVQCNVQATLLFVVSAEVKENKSCWKNFAIQGLSKQSNSDTHPSTTSLRTQQMPLFCAQRTEKRTTVCSLLKLAATQGMPQYASHF